MKRDYIPLLFFAVLVIVAIAPVRADMLAHIEESDILNVEIDSGVFDTFVHITNDDVVEIRVIGSKRYRVDVNRSGNSLSVTVTRRRGIFYSLFSGNEPPQMDVFLPKETHLNVTSSEGDFFAEGFFSSDVEVTTASGNISMDGGVGKATIFSASGEISLGDWQGELTVIGVSGTLAVKRVQGTMDAATTSGTISLGSVEGKCLVASVSGEIFVESALFTEDSNFATVSGNIDLQISGDAYQFDLASTSGNVSVGNRRGNQSPQTDKGRVKLTAKSVSGSIEIRFP